MEQKTILVVDDSEQDRELLTQILEDHDFVIITQNDGSDAVEYLDAAEEKPDLILMDMSMQKMSGHTAFNIIKSKEAFENTPFIFITGRDKTKDLFEATKADDFIIKPYDEDNLVMRIKRVLADYDLRKQQ